jgi:hypothetical protein
MPAGPARMMPHTRDAAWACGSHKASRAWPGAHAPTGVLDTHGRARTMQSPPTFGCAAAHTAPTLHVGSSSGGVCHPAAQR